MPELRNEKITMHGSFKPDPSLLEYINDIQKNIGEPEYDITITYRSGKKITRHLTRSQTLELFGIPEEFLEEHKTDK